jgi:hypothetical protein
MLTLPEINQKFKDAHKKERIVTFPNCPVAFNQQKKKLVQKLEIAVNVSEKRI